jgi:hypothetical protein
MIVVMRTACQEEHKANKIYRQFYRQLALACGDYL